MRVMPLEPLSIDEIQARAETAFAVLSVMHQRLPAELDEQAAYELGQATGLLSRALDRLRQAP